MHVLFLNQTNYITGMSLQFNINIINDLVLVLQVFNHKIQSNNNNCNTPISKMHWNMHTIYYQSTEYTWSRHIVM